MAGRFTVETVFKAIDRITAPVTRMQNRVGKFTRGMERGLRRANRSTDRFFKGMKTGAVAAAASLLIVATAMGNVVKIGAEFEQQIVNATVKMAGIDKSSAGFINTLRDLEEAARKQGSTTEFTASQAAAALNNLARSGLNVKQSIAALPGAIDFATTSETDLIEATETATGALSVFGLKVSDTVQLGKNLARVNDVLALTANSSKASMADLAETLKDGGSVMHLIGGDVETFGALSAFMAEGLIKGSKAGMTMKNMVLQLANPAGDAQRVLRKLGITVADSEGNFRDIADILEDLEKQLVGMGTKDKAAIIETIFGKRAIAGVSKILEKGTGEFRDYREMLRGANGESKQMAAIMRDTLGGSMKAFTSIVESVKISVFNLRKEGLKGLIDTTVAWIRVNEKMIASRIDKFITKVGAAIGFLIKHRTAIGRTIAVVMGLIVAMKILIGVLTVVNLVMSANPISLIIIGVAFLIGLIALMIANWDKVVAFFTGLPGPVKTAFRIIFAQVFLLIDLVKLIINNWGMIKQFYIDLWADVGTAFSAAMEWMSNGIKGVGMMILDFLLAPIESLLGLLSKLPGKLGELSRAGLDAVQSTHTMIAQSLDSDSSGSSASPNVVSPQARTARSIEERRSFSSAEVTIRDDTGRAEVTDGALGTGLILLPSGAF